MLNSIGSKSVQKVSQNLVPKFSYRYFSKQNYFAKPVSSIFNNSTVINDYNTTERKYNLKNLGFQNFYSDQPIEEAEVLDEVVNDPKTEDVPEKPAEKVVGEATSHSFKTETQKILHIVAQSLYTDKEVFVRELISNSSDALEKIKIKVLSNEPVEDPDLPLEITLTTDAENRTLTIQDSGCGMTKEELMENLGSIGKSGTSEFLQKLEENKSNSSDLIGQFGVGFYSCFMVGNNVKVFTKSSDVGSPGYLWEADGDGDYKISEAEGVSRGTKVIIQLKDESIEFSKRKVIDDIIKKYSNFVNYDIALDGKNVNTIQALWTMNPKQITEEQHKEFYQFMTKSYDAHQFVYHFQTDSPLDIKALFYVPDQHSEKYGMGKMEGSVSLFARKVLIQQKTKLLPDWLRFVRGVVDSEDISLNISREHLQNSDLITRIGKILTKKFLGFLATEAKKDETKYQKFFSEFGSFLKEGVCTDFQHKADLGKLLRMESSFTKPGEVTSLDDYISRLPEDQKDIFYLCIPNRNFAESSPYYEGFKSKGREVLFFYTQMDEFVMSNLGDYQGKKLVTIESSSADAADADNESEEVKPTETKHKNIEELAEWMKEALPERLAKVKITERLVDSPAIIVDHESATFRKMMKYVDPERAPKLPKQVLEINPNHPVIQKLSAARVSNPTFCQEIAEQILDNALVAAGLIDDARAMLPRLNAIMETALASSAKKSAKTKKYPKEPEGVYHPDPTGLGWKIDSDTTKDIIYGDEKNTEQTQTQEATKETEGAK